MKACLRGTSSLYEKMCFRQHFGTGCHLFIWVFLPFDVFINFIEICKPQISVVQMQPNSSLTVGYSYKVSCARPGQAVICSFWHPGTLTLSPESQNVRMSKITNDGLTRSGTGCFIAVPVWQQWVSKVNILVICDFQFQAQNTFRRLLCRRRENCCVAYQSGMI